MESSTNLQQDHQFQEYLAAVSSSLSSPSSSVAEHHHHGHSWRSSPSFFLNNNNNINATCGEESSPTSFNIEQDLGSFSLPNNNTTNNSNHSDNYNPSFKKFSDIMLSPTTLSPTYKTHMLQPSSFDHQPSIRYRDHSTNNDLPNLQGSKGVTAFSQIFPSVNISKLSSSSVEMSSSNIEDGFDSFAMAPSLMGGGSVDQAAAPSNHLLELFKGGSPCGVDHVSQQSDDTSTNNLSSFDNNGVLEAKRSSYILEPESITHLTPSKKQRFESRASYPPLKVRKEKLGDRVAALQQLVAPFGKTDTASVLMEAIGYIKFLHNLLETLSVPYMKLASRTRSTNNNQRNSGNEDPDSCEQEPDLRRRGLCLVPLSCMSYITTDPCINEAAWPYPHSSDPGF